MALPTRTEYADYLGDGVYIDIQPGASPDFTNVILTAENGIRATDTIYLDSEVIVKFEGWLKRLRDMGVLPQ